MSIGGKKEVECQLFAAVYDYDVAWLQSVSVFMRHISLKTKK